MTATIRQIFVVIVTLYALLSVAGCATTTATLPPEVPAMHTVSELGADSERIAYVDDPWNGFNRRMYKFNYHFDKYVFLPVVSGYEFVTPTFAQKGVSNFFSNVGEIRTIYNSLFQLKGGKALTTLGRFVTNSTVGLAGFLDPATLMGMKRQDEDFGQTLGYWGVGTGPYLVLPVLGPGTVRSQSGFAVDAAIRYALVSAVDPYENVDHRDGVQAGVTILEAIDNRHQESFRYYESGYPFEYYIVRFLYREKRELDTMK